MRRVWLAMVCGWLGALAALSAASAAKPPDAIVLDDSMGLVITGDNKAELTVHEKIKVLNSQGQASGYATIRESDFVKLKRFRASVTTPDGKLIDSWVKDDGIRSCGFSGAVIYSDVCALDFFMSAGNYPYLVDCEYTLAYKSLFFWPEWSPQTGDPVDRACFMLTAPDDFKFDFKEVGAVPAPVIQDKSGRTSWYWEIADLPAFEDEEYSSVQPSDLVGIKFSPQRMKFGEYLFEGPQWGDLARTYMPVLKDKLRLSPEQDSLLSALRNTTNLPREFCENLHRELLLKTRYVAVEIGLGGWEPHPASETFACSYGDCKDLATLHLSFLRAYGLDAKVALVSTRGSGEVLPELPALSVFNHMILFAILDHDTLWIDPTCSECTVGDLPESDEGVAALVIDSTAGGLVRTPVSQADDNRFTRTAALTIQPDKSVLVHLTLNAVGNPAHLLETGRYKTGKGQKREVLQGGRFGLDESLVPDSIFYPAEPVLSQSQAVLFGKVRNPFHTLGPKLCLDLSFLSLFAEPERIRLSDRVGPLDLAYSVSWYDTISIAPPENWAVVSLPEAASLEDEYGRVEISFHPDSGRVVAYRTRTITKPLIQPSEFDLFKTHIDSFQKLSDRFIAFERRSSD